MKRLLRLMLVFVTLQSRKFESACGEHRQKQRLLGYSGVWAVPPETTGACREERPKSITEVNSVYAQTNPVFRILQITSKVSNRTIFKQNH